jgi:hypothetical protein
LAGKSQDERDGEADVGIAHRRLVGEAAPEIRSGGRHEIDEKSPATRRTLVYKAPAHFSRTLQELGS